MRSKSWIALSAFLALCLTACPEKRGPAEEAGKALDDAAESVGDALSPDGPAEEAGEKIDRALGQ